MLRIDREPRRNTENIMALSTGAWINPFYNLESLYNPTTSASLASIPDWTWAADPVYGFTKTNVDRVRSSTGGKVFISFGGAGAVGHFWGNMAADPNASSQQMIEYLTRVGADGVRYDIEEGPDFTVEVNAELAKMMQIVKDSGKGFIQSMSVLAGSYDVYKPILDANVLDEVIVLCYNGGVFIDGNPSGGGLDWKGWMNKWIGYMGANKNKLVVGLCIQYNSSVQYYADESLVQEAEQYCRENGLVGVYFWWYSSDAPGTLTLNNLISILN